MPSSEDVIEAQRQVKEWAKQALMREGHSEFSAEEIVKRMHYNEQIEYAEKIQGEIYRGPYSPY